MYQRIAIVGKSGSGKTTLAFEVAEKLSLPLVELDALNWQAGWNDLTKPEMRAKVEKTLIPDAQWVADGNYLTSIRDVVWTRADTLIWLDYPLYVAHWRLLKRTFDRIVFKRELWNGNRETLWHHLTSGIWNNLFSWSTKLHFKMRREVPVWLEMEENKHLTVLRFRSSKETQAWLDRLGNKKDD